MKKRFPETVPEHNLGKESSGEKPSGVSRREFLRKAAAGLAGLAVAGEGGRSFAKAPIEDEKEQWETERLLRGWEEQKRVIREARVRENIALVERSYGEKSTAILLKIKEDLQLIDQLMAVEAQDKNALLHNPNKALLRFAVDNFAFFWDRRNFDSLAVWDEKRLGLGATFAFAGSGFSDKRVQKELEKRFDKRWLYGSASVFVYVPMEKYAQTFQVSGEAENASMLNIFTKNGDERVVVYRSEDAKNMTGLLDILSHEIAHHQDWESNNRLPIQERLAFLVEVTSRLESDDRCRFPYVEETIPGEYKDASPGFVKYRQAREYWASLNERYDRDRMFVKYNDLKTYYSKDYKLVEQWRRRLTEKPQEGWSRFDPYVTLSGTKN